MVKKPLVSVAMTAYNQEEYIAEAIESVLMQKVKFDYEILIGDDASSDKTAQILDNYQNRYPELITVYHRKTNLGTCKNSYDIFSRCRGKYIAKLEGDDYWIYDLKLQRQVEYLESHPNIIAVAHNVLCVDQYGTPLPEELIDFPHQRQHVFGRRNAMNHELFGHISSLMARNFRDIMTERQWRLYIQSTVRNDDLLTSITLGMLGVIYYMEDEWTCRRKIFDGNVSFTAINKNKNLTKFICSNMFKIQQYLEIAFNQKTDISDTLAYLLKKNARIALKDFNKENLRSVQILFVSYVWSLRKKMAGKSRKICKIA